MKNLLSLILISLFFNLSLAQKSESELLKDYDFYIEKNLEMGNWSSKYYLSNGYINTQENYWKKELRSRYVFKYDRYGNIEREKTTYDINEGKINEISDIELEYNDTLLISKTFGFGMTEKYSDFNKLGKPKLIERNEASQFKAFPYKESIEYDNGGNVSKTIKLSVYEDLNGETINEKATVHYKYDHRNNVIEIHREYEPKQKFPIPITGGPFLYEYEYFRYKYNKNGLWTKKYKTVNGKENLIAKRKYQS